MVINVWLVSVDLVLVYYVYNYNAYFTNYYFNEYWYQVVNVLNYSVYRACKEEFNNHIYVEVRFCVCSFARNNWDSLLKIHYAPTYNFQWFYFSFFHRHFIHDVYVLTLKNFTYYVDLIVYRWYVWVYWDWNFFIDHSNYYLKKYL